MLILSSCGSSTFYAYDNAKDGEYCTIEVDRKGYSTYRGIRHPKYADWSYKRFIYMKSDEKNLESYYDLYRIGSYVDLNRISTIYYVDEFNTCFDVAFLFLKSDSCYLNNRISYRIEEDSVFFNSCICTLEDPEFQEVTHGRYWLPPYLKKVDNIDYSKFSMFKVKKKFLKNPAKKGAPKSWGK